VKGYRKHFSVDLQCAIQELQMLGVVLEAGYVEAVRRTFANTPRRRKDLGHGDAPIATLVEADQNFAYIAGYTEGGFPYGITWEEADEQEPVWNFG